MVAVKVASGRCREQAWNKATWGVGMPPKRRAYGSGSVSQRASDGLWVGILEAGWTAKGTRRRIRVAAKTKAEAQRRLKERQREIAAHGLPAAGISARATVKSWATDWLELTQRTLRPMTWKTNKGCVDKWIVPTIGTKKLTTLTPADLRAVANAQRDAGLKPSSTLRTHAVLAKMLKAASSEGHLIPGNVLTAARPQTNESDRGAIPRPDALAIIKAAGQLPDGSRWLVGILEGLRQSEVLGLTWAAVDLDARMADVSWQLQSLPWADRKAGILRIPDGFECRQVWKSFHLVRPKTESGKRLVPLVAPVVAALREWRPLAPVNPAGLIWPRPDGTPRPAKLDGEQWRAIQDAAGVKHSSGRYYSGHEMRHSCATLLREEGIDTTVIKAIMGHATVLSTKAYLHSNQDDARAGLAAMVAGLQLG